MDGNQLEMFMQSNLWGPGLALAWLHIHPRSHCPVMLGQLTLSPAIARTPGSFIFIVLTQAHSSQLGTHVQHPHRHASLVPEGC